MADTVVDLGVILPCPVCKRGDIHRFKTVLRLRSDQLDLHCSNCSVVAQEPSPGVYQLTSWPPEYSYMASYYEGVVRAPVEWKFIAPFILNNAQIDAIDNGKFRIMNYIPPMESPLILQAGERALVNLPNVRYMEDRTVRVRDSLGMSYGLRGTGMRVYYPASSHAENIKTVVDNGVFCLTNKRYAFVGPSKTVSAKIDRIISITSYSDGFAIARTGKQKVEFFVNYPGILFGAVIREVLRELQNPDSAANAINGDLIDPEVKLLASSL